jgi:hypothetical protein
MKTLRLLRNVAVLFILLMANLASQPAVGFSGAKPLKACVGAVKSGYNCTVDYTNGGCTETKCGSKSSCGDNRCVKIGRGF